MLFYFEKSKKHAQICEEYEIMNYVVGFGIVLPLSVGLKTFLLKIPSRSLRFIPLIKVLQLVSKRYYNQNLMVTVTNAN